MELSKQEDVNRIVREKYDTIKFNNDRIEINKNLKNEKIPVFFMGENSIINTINKH